jgi:hypothetical protein
MRSCGSIVFNQKISFASAVKQLLSISGILALPVCVSFKYHSTIHAAYFKSFKKQNNVKVLCFFKKQQFIPRRRSVY